MTPVYQRLLELWEAEGYGAHGEFVQHEEEIGPAVRRALACGRAAVVHVVSNGTANVGDVPGHKEYSTWYKDFLYSSNPKDMAIILRGDQGGLNNTSRAGR